ncbi:uncharacterized protein LOC121849673 [Callorhinchus milii]|uniref:uncharacterized protein LOC121849673 n=1 Tax=Callorhinchus milii TaxID=7868 RepID=UPI001C3FB0DF|nr:uncharacterized protein LOC121849673 [Callorhinchus milii]
MISYIRDLQEIADDIYLIHKLGPRVGVGQSVAGGADNTAACDTDTVTQTYGQERVNDIMEQYAKDSREMAECYTKLSRAVRILKRYGEKSETTFPGGADTEHLAVFAAVAETMNKQVSVTSKAGSAAQTRLPFISSLISRANDGHNLNRGTRADAAKHIHGVAEVMENEVMAYEEVYKHLEDTVSNTEVREAFLTEMAKRTDDVQSFKAQLPDWREQVRGHLRALREAADHIDNLHRSDTAQIIVGSILRPAGVILFIAGIITGTTLGDKMIERLEFILGLELMGVVMGAVGTGVISVARGNITASQTEKVRRVNGIIEQYKTDSRAMADCYNKLNRIIQLFMKSGRDTGKAEMFSSSSGVFPLIVDMKATRRVNPLRAVLQFLSAIVVVCDVASAIMNILNCCKRAKSGFAQQIREVANMMESERRSCEEFYKPVENDFVFP